MEIKIMEKVEIEKVVADEIVRLMQKKPNCVLGLATGSSPLGIYQELIHRYQNHEISFKNVTTYNLDEYVGLAPSHPKSYHSVMHHMLFSHIDIPLHQTHIPNGIQKEESIASYDEQIEKDGGIDLQLLGIGRNGHIAFNEPGTSFQSRVHLVTLDEKTRKDNARFFDKEEDVPHEAITMGLASIMKAKRIILLGFGANKKEAIRRLLMEPANENLPASILRNHPNVTIYCDQASAPELEIKK